jgi:hypothetical protein
MDLLDERLKEMMDVGRPHWIPSMRDLVKSS